MRAAFMTCCITTRVPCHLLQLLPNSILQHHLHGSMMCKVGHTKSDIWCTRHRIDIQLKSTSYS